MKGKDSTTIIIDELENFAEGENLKFLYSQERRPEGSLIIYFGSRTEDVKGQQSYRISYNDRTTKDPMDIVNDIKENARKIFNLK